MAIPTAAVWEMNASATAGSVNGGGFDPSCTGFISNLAATSATGNAPVITTASYNFVAGDVGHYVYIKSGTNWTPGWYKISSVAANAATVDATIGQVVLSVTNGIVTYNTVAGCATVASPTAGTGGIDYSRSTAAILSATDLVIGASNVTITSVAAPFGPNHPGNVLHITAGVNFTQGWYVINSVAATVATLDRACGTALSTAGTGKTGGAISFNSTLDDAFFENAVPGNVYFTKAGTYSLGVAMLIAAAGTATNLCCWIGYNTIRGDNPTGSNRPVLTVIAAFPILIGGYWSLENLIITGVGEPAFQTAADNTRLFNCKIVTTSTNVGNVAANLVNYTTCIGCEFISYRGYAVQISTVPVVIIGCYIHDSDIGIRVTSATALYSTNFSYNLLENNVTAAIRFTSTAGGLNVIMNNTLYGAENKLGLGIDFAAGNTTPIVMNNIIYGFTTGVTHASTQTWGYDDYNDYYNNTNDVSAAGQWQKRSHDLALNPTFTTVAQVTFSNGSTAGSVLTSAGADFSGVTDNVDFCLLKSGTGITVGQYLITAHTGTTLTLSPAPGANATTDKVGQVTTGRNFAIGTNLKATAYPGAFSSATTGYLDMGGVQRQEAGGAGGASSHTFGS